MEELKENQVKLSDQHLNLIHELRNEMSQCLIDIGRITVEINLKNEDLKNLQENIKSLNEREKSLESDIVAEYGKGNLDLSTGILTKME